MAKKITDAELDKVAPAVVKEFKEALAEAEELLASGTATQAQVDKSFDRLSKVMQMLSFEKGDKAELQALVDKIEALDSKEYITNTWDNLQKQLEVAKGVIANENAMEKEVSETYDSLMKAFLELRLKPSKEKLEELIKKAEGLDSSKYTASSWNKLEKALKLAKEVYVDDDATEEEIANAEKSLSSALDELVIADSDNGNDNNNNNNNNNGNSGDNGNSGNNGSNSGNSNKPSNSGKLPQTGGTNALVTLFTGLAAIGGGLLFRRKNNNKKIVIK